MLINPKLALLNFTSYWSSKLCNPEEKVEKKRKKHKNGHQNLGHRRPFLEDKGRPYLTSPSTQRTQFISLAATLYTDTRRIETRAGRFSGQFTIRKTHKTGSQDKTLGSTIVWHKRVTNDSRFITFIFFYFYSFVFSTDSVTFWPVRSSGLPLAYHIYLNQMWNPLSFPFRAQFISLSRFPNKKEHMLQTSVVTSDFYFFHIPFRHLYLSLRILAVFCFSCSIFSCLLCWSFYPQCP